MKSRAKHAIRSAAAIVAGCLTLLLLVMVIYLILGIFFPKAYPTVGVVPSIPWAIFLLIWGLLSAAAGAYVTSVICAGSRVWHVFGLMAAILVLGLLFLAGNVYKQPTWYLIAQAVVWMIGAMIGGSVPVAGKSHKG
ncbi:hypothetical protein C3F09_06900 [candidate division GN15 bacterium]|uniref:TIGR04086 family membrane protein n=1 Tax=candidate division GN15 bacterium TaxID=2072418 RepID=A0A855X6Q9_9BACT|nr:MAG: hypothetical protein C3F09_06900 [candidate division GN15 bacterium]